jgi:hypothetical protein
MQEVERVNKNKNNLNWCRQCEVSWVVSYYLYSYGHMPFGGEHVVFGLAQTSWWVNGI